jgi:hypothetical protein
MGVANHVEIPKNKPGCVRVEVEGDGFEFVEERREKLVRGRGIDVSDIESEVRSSGGEADGEGMLSGERTGRVEIQTIPSSQHPP